MILRSALVQTSRVVSLLLLTGVGLTNASGASDPAIPTKPALVIKTQTVPKAEFGVAYSAKLQATGGTPGYNWAAGSGTLPAGLALSSSGVLSGTPSASGDYSVAVVVADAGKPQVQAMRTFSLTVAPAKLAITSSSLPAGTVRQAYNFAATAAGGSGS